MRRNAGSAAGGAFTDLLLQEAHASVRRACVLAMSRSIIARPLPPTRPHARVGRRWRNDSAARDGQR
jgi:hypothetical protein